MSTDDIPPPPGPTAAQPGEISEYLARVERERGQLRDEQRERLSQEGTLDLDEAFKSSHIGEVLAKLDREFIGLVPVKKGIREIADTLLIDSMRGRLGLAAQRPPLHMTFTGHPGTGKTTVALRMAEILYRLGYIRKGHLVTAARDDLVSQYIGHSAPRTKEALKRAMGGVLFIEDAPNLHDPQNVRDYGDETLAVLAAEMQSAREEVVIVFGGYREHMGAFLQRNPGLASRVPYFLDFPAYSGDELLAIARMLLERLNYDLTPAAEQAFSEYVARRMQQPGFANARSIFNAIDRARLRQATRLFEEGRALTARELRLIDESDIRQSWVFHQPTA